ncbi:hypothetical protein M514_08405, partial [Trichuris suis]
LALIWQWCAALFSRTICLDWGNVFSPRAGGPARCTPGPGVVLFTHTFPLPSTLEVSGVAEMRSSNSCRSVRTGRRVIQSHVGVSRRSVRASTGSPSPQGSLEVSAPTGAIECITNPGADALMSHLTSQISTLLSSFSDHLVKRLLSPRVNGDQETVPSSFLGDSHLPATRSIKDCPTLSRTSSSSCMSPAERVQRNSNQSSRSRNDNVADGVQAITQNGSSVTRMGGSQN